MRPLDSTSEPWNQNFHVLQVSQLSLRSRKVWETRKLKEDTSVSFAGTWADEDALVNMFKTSVVTLAESCQEPMGHQGMWEGGVGGGERMAMQEGAKIVPRNRELPRLVTKPPSYSCRWPTLHCHFFWVSTKFHPDSRDQTTHLAESPRVEGEDMRGGA